MKKLLAIFIVLALVVPLAAQRKPKPKTPPAPPPAAAAVSAKQEPGPPAKPGEAEPKPYDKVVTPEFSTQTGLIKVHTLKGKVLFRDPQTRAGQGPPARRPDHEEPERVELSGPVRRGHGRPLGTAREQSPPADGVLRQHRRSQRAHQQGRRGDEHSHDHDGLPRRGLGRRRLAGHRRDQVFHQRRERDPGEEGPSGGQSLDATRTFLDKVRVYPDQPERRGHPDLQSQAGPRSPAGLAAPIRRYAASAAQPDGRRPLLVRQASRKADDGPPRSTRGSDISPTATPTTAAPSTRRRRATSSPAGAWRRRIPARPRASR